LQSQVVADPASDKQPAEMPIAIPTSVHVDSKKQEISRLQQDVAAGRAEIEVIKDQNELMHSRMKDLKSRILELKRRVLDENEGIDNPDRR